MSYTIRRYKRYPVSGKILFQMDSREVTGKLVDISSSGALIHGKVKPFEEDEFTALLEVHDYPRMFEVRGVVVRVHSDSWTMIFVEEPAGLAELLRCLDERAKKEAVSPIGT